MAETAADYRRYLDPRTLAKVSSIDLRARLIVEGLTGGMHRSPYQGISVEFAQHRPYVQGDDVRHVDWKVYGRSEKIYLKQYLEETNLHLILIVDASESMGYSTVKADNGKTWTKYDHATAIAATMSYLAVQQQDSAGLAIFDQQLARYFKPSNSPAQWKLVVNELNLTPRRQKTGIGKVLDQIAEKVTQRSLVILVSDFFDDLASIRTGLRHMRYRKHEVMCFQILDPTEIDFPFEDVTLFKGMEETGQLITEPKSLRAGYLEELQRFTDELKKTCRGMNVDFNRFSSGDTLDVALSQFLANRAASIK